MVAGLLRLRRGRGDRWREARCGLGVREQVAQRCVLAASLLALVKLRLCGRQLRFETCAALCPLPILVLQCRLHTGQCYRDAR